MSFKVNKDSLVKSAILSNIQLDDELRELEKGGKGPGSRGGKVIGTYPSGQPKYESDKTDPKDTGIKQDSSGVNHNHAQELAQKIENLKQMNTHSKQQIAKFTDKIRSHKLDIQHLKDKDQTRTSPIIKDKEKYIKELQSKIDTHRANIEANKTEIRNITDAYTYTKNNLEKAFEVLGLEKARPTKYFKREGTPGNYKYYYSEKEYKQSKNKGDLLSVGSKVKLDPSIGLISLSNLKDRELTVVGTVNTGLISQPKFLQVKDDKGDIHELNPDYVKPIADSSSKSSPPQNKIIAGEPYYWNERLKQWKPETYKFEETKSKSKKEGEPYYKLTEKSTVNEGSTAIIKEDVYATEDGLMTKKELQQAGLSEDDEGVGLYLEAGSKITAMNNGSGYDVQWEGEEGQEISLHPDYLKDFKQKETKRSRKSSEKRSAKAVILLSELKTFQSREGNEDGMVISDAALKTSHVKELLDEGVVAVKNGKIKYVGGDKIKGSSSSEEKHQKLTPMQVGAFSSEKLKGLNIQGTLNGEPGVFRNFKKDTSGRVVASFRYSQKSPSGMNRSSSGHYMTDPNISFEKQVESSFPQKLSKARESLGLDS